MASSGGGMYAFPPTLDPSWSLKGSSRYVTVQALNKGSLATVNIFLVTKSIRACATVEDIRKNFKAGTYTVRVPNEAQAKQLKDKLTVLGDQITKVEVVDDEFRNTSRAVISCRDLIGVTEEQIVEELSEQGIKAARHLKKVLAVTFFLLAIDSIRQYIDRDVFLELFADDITLGVSDVNVRRARQNYKL
ncbi:hypothetical protein quinque_000349 [Culex quinquefasciatus]